MRAKGDELRRASRPALEKAITRLERAVELDPDFAVPYAELVYLRAYSFNTTWNMSDANLQRARYELEMAPRLGRICPR